MDSKKDIYKSSVELVKQYESNPIRGLTNEQVQKNAEKYGRNEITPAKKDPLWKQFLEKFKDPTIIILCICAAISIGIGAYHGEFPWEGVGIFIAVSIATGVGFWSEFKADKAFETLKADSENIQVKVIREGLLKVIFTRELVVGDIIEIENGDKIPADGVLINSTEMQIDESLMTGESLPVNKSEDDTKVIGGTVVVSGHGRVLITKVGDKMEMGEILRALSNSEVEDTPLQIKLGELASLISRVGTSAAIAIFFSLFSSALMIGTLGATLDTQKIIISQTHKIIVLSAFGAVIFGLVASFLIKKNSIRNIVLYGLSVLALIALIFVTFFGATNINYAFALKGILDYFIVAVTIIVVAVPEGLPMAVTISLALSMRKIRQDNNLVRKMLATETIGSVNVVCSDKTGTLTKNQMEVQEVLYQGVVYKRNEFEKLKNANGFELLKTLISSNSTANIVKEDGEIKVVGNSTEGALLKWMGELGVDFYTLRDEVEVFHRIAFNSERKIMSTTTGFSSCKNCNLFSSQDVCKIDKSCRVTFVKGAPERVIELCSDVIVKDKVDKLNNHIKSIESFIGELSGKGMRVIALAYKVHTQEEFNKKPDNLDSLGFLGLVAISDPVREDVPKAVEVALNAGIDVKMVTGDNAVTAAAIAKEVGLLKEKGIVLEGADFRKKTDDELAEILLDLKVLARATPLDKERLVGLLQSRHNLVVAVTGDGTNDAPALKKADVGISMGLRGTDVAKEASDIVLTDDNFGSIVKAVKWGRTLYENVQKFLQFQLTINFSALLIAILSPILKIIFPTLNFQTIPLTVIQLLWINLVMDTLAALALGLEPPRDEIMKDKPKRKNESFLTGIMKYNIFTMGTCFTIFILLQQAFDILGTEKLQGKYATSSVIFTTYIFMQVFNLFNARSVKSNASIFKNISKSASFLIVLGVIVVVQILITTFGHSFFNTQPLPLYMWGKVLIVGLATLLLGMFFRTLRKVIIR